MTLEEAIQHLKESLTDPTHKWGCEECKQEHEQLLVWLEDYQKVKEENERMPKIDLLPCPFCGKPDTAKITTVSECEYMDNPTEWDKTHYGAVCSFVVGGCGASTGWYYETPEEAAKAWNIRASGWIPCSVKKPEAHKPVLVVIKDNGRYTWIYIGETGEEGNWMIGGEFWYSKSDTSITHWMPLPELPKGV